MRVRVGLDELMGEGAVGLGELSFWGGELSQPTSSNTRAESTRMVDMAGEMLPHAGRSQKRLGAVIAGSVRGPSAGSDARRRKSDGFFGTGGGTSFESVPE